MTIFICKKGGIRSEYYLDQAKPSKDNSLKRFVRYGNIVIRAKDD